MLFTTDILSKAVDLGRNLLHRNEFDRNEKYAIKSDHNRGGGHEYDRCLAKPCRLHENKPYMQLIPLEKKDKQSNRTIHVSVL